MIQTVGKFSATTVQYTSYLKASNGVVEYEASYTVPIATYYSASKVIPTTLSWLNRKYVKNYYENQVRFLEAVSGQTTPYFRMRLTSENTFGATGSNNYIRVYTKSTTVFKSSTSSDNLICMLLPAISAEKDFTIGYYGECSRAAEGGTSYIYYTMKGPFGGWDANGDYLLHIQEPNVVTTSFAAPT